MTYGVGYIKPRIKVTWCYQRNVAEVKKQLAGVLGRMNIYIVSRILNLLGYLNIAYTLERISELPNFVLNWHKTK